MNQDSTQRPGDYLVRAISDEANVRALVCVTTGLVEAARRLHETSPTVTTALGRALSAGALMGALLKQDQRVGLKFEGDGPMKKIIVEADSGGTLRGCVGLSRIEEAPDAGRLSVSRALGTEGYLTVIRDEGQREPYQGIVRLQTGEIAEDLAAYYVESEQIPTALGLGVYVEADESVSAAGGFLVQSLPGADEKSIDRLIETLRFRPPMTTLLRENRTPEDILALIFEGLDVHILEKRDLALRCTCNRDRIEQVLISLGPAELERLILEEGLASVICEFCLQNYSFDADQLRSVLEEALCRGNNHEKNRPVDQ